MEEIAKALREKYPKVKVPTTEAIRAWTEKQLHDYYERQAYLDSMFSSSSDESSSNASSDGENEPSETTTVAKRSDNRGGSAIIGEILQKKKFMKQEVENPLDHIQSKRTITELSSTLDSLQVADQKKGGEKKKKRVLVYGATGYTGQLICKHAIACGMDITPSGRNEHKLQRLSKELQVLLQKQKEQQATGNDPTDASMSFPLSYLCLELKNSAKLDAALEGIDIVVHCAGPFVETFAPMVEACIRAGVHYIDINGEIGVIEGISKYDKEARERGVMLLPAAGFDVVPSDTLVHLLHQRFKERHFQARASEIDLSFHFNKAGALISRGTGNVMKGGKRGVSVSRQGGAIVERVAKPVPLKERRKCFYGFVNKEMTVKPANMADVASAFYSTGIENVRCFMSDVASMLQLRCVMTPFSERTSDRNSSKEQPIGPSAEENKEGKAYLQCSISAKDGKERVSGSLVCPAPYKVTYLAVGHILQEIQNKNHFKVGFCTPSLAYGKQFFDVCDMEWQVDD
jgi:short subunit dehydrogenase-like uncharacterized protein